MLTNRIGSKAFVLPLTELEKLDFLHRWYGWFYKASEDWSVNGLGEDIAYLFGAVLNDTVIEVDNQSELLKLIKNNDVPKTDRIWKFLQFPSN